MPDSALKCLLVDDAEPMLQVLAQYVELLGFEPILAHDGDEGIAAFRACHPSLVVSDINMPNRNGLLLLRDIKRMNPECPVILISGMLLDYRAAVSSNPVQPDVLIEKPFSLMKLQKVIEDLTPAIQKAWDKIDESDELS
jgi:DNA-binding NtrC family response regulator